MSSTKNDIINLANELIKSVGYNGFSYADISGKLNMKNAAIHYYFPAKGDLGVEVIRVNLDAFLEKTTAWRSLDCRKQLESYITMHDSFTDNYWTCIVGALSSSYDTLPENMQKALDNLINTILNWLTDLLTAGKENGTFSFSENPRTKAYLIHSAMLSALLMNKVLKNDVYHSIQKSLLAL